MNIPHSAEYQRHRRQRRLTQTLSITGQDCVCTTEDCVSALSPVPGGKEVAKSAECRAAKGAHLGEVSQAPAVDLKDEEESPNVWLGEDSPGRIAHQGRNCMCSKQTSVKADIWRN